MESGISSQAFDLFAQNAATVVTDDIQSWKRDGGKILGYFCSAMPEEMATAGGILPVRLRATGSDSTELSDAFLSSLNCTFPRHAFNMALKGEYDFIDALVMFNSCDHVRRIYDHWTRQINTPLVKILSLPKKGEQPQIDWFKSELEDLRGDLQKHFDVELSDAALWEAIKLHNRQRALLRRLYELRKSEAPPITGAEALAVTVSSTTMAAARYNEVLEELLDDLSRAEGIGGRRARLMIMGGELDNPDYIREIEEQGCLVVADSLCFGSRLFWKDVREDFEDPLDALAYYYVADRPSCARMFTEYENRAAYIREMISEYDVDGAVFERLTFCEIYGFEQFSITNDFKQWDIPLLCMDREYVLGAVGQLRTRVQAFLETLENN